MEPHGLPTEESKRILEPPTNPSLSQASEEHDPKSVEILDACARLDLEKLRRLATSDGGLVSDNVRRRACSCDPESDAWDSADIPQGLYFWDQQ
jgi:hypothetical protein